ncbi:MAG: chemotaxis protein CheX [Bryobacteraceae bacterium]
MIHELLISEIAAATTSVFSTMLGLEAVPGEPRLGAVVGPATGVVALVGVAGPYSGTGCINCSETLACRAASLMLMGEYAGIDGEVLDAMGEIANMVIGNIKTNLEDRFGAMGLSTPTVLSGERVSAKALTKTGWTIVPFTCEGETFCVQMTLAEAGAQHVHHREFHHMELVSH